MKEFEITEKGVFVYGVELEVGARVKHESMPVTLVNKAIEVESVEVEAPRRGRPPKDKE
jgi:hypothetical protein